MDVGKQNFKYPIGELKEDILKLAKRHKNITKRTMKEKEWGSVDEIDDNEIYENPKEIKIK